MKKNVTGPMPKEELELWLKLRKKCAAMRAKKGKGSYKRNKKINLLDIS